VNCSAVPRSAHRSPRAAPCASPTASRNGHSTTLFDRLRAGLTGSLRGQSGTVDSGGSRSSRRFLVRLGSGRSTRRVNQCEGRLGRDSSRPTECHRRSPGRPRPAATGRRGPRRGPPRGLRYAPLLGEQTHLRKPRLLAGHRPSRNRATLRHPRRQHSISLSDTTNRADGGAARPPRVLLCAVAVG
jgi:hypothetical protein